MKKFLILFLGLVMNLTICSCGSESSSKKHETKYDNAVEQKNAAAERTKEAAEDLFETLDEIEPLLDAAKEN